MHIVEIASVVLNGVGSMALIWLPDRVREYTPDGLWIPRGSSMSEAPGTPAEKRRNIRRYHLRKAAFLVSVGLLVIGIGLQILVLVHK